MSSIITYLPFISTAVIIYGINYENMIIAILGAVLMAVSFVGLLYQCGADFRDEIERSNNLGNYKNEVNK
jgi:hypothetical protein